jgi:hypothetical protein
MKTINKWEIGLVGFASSDLSSPTVPETCRNGKNCVANKQSQVALGGLVGYEFTGITTQFYATRDVATENYCNIGTAVFADNGSILRCDKAFETRLWLRVIIPLWNPPAEPMK